MATILGTRELITEDLNVDKTHFTHLLKNKRKSNPVNKNRLKKTLQTALHFHRPHSHVMRHDIRNMFASFSYRISSGLPNIEAVVGIWGVFGPLEQSPLELHRDLCDGVGRQLDQHFEQVGPHAVLGRLVVDVAWCEKTNANVY